MPPMPADRRGPARAPARAAGRAPSRWTRWRGGGRARRRRRRARRAARARAARELDFVVEGDAAAVARRAAARLGGEVVVHDRFGTATVRARRGTFDVVSARARSATRGPARCPRWSSAPRWREDLARRDFTVNAIAARPRRRRSCTARAGRAGRPRRAGACACCTTRSFLDDATRLLRLARYAARLGFRAERGDGRAGRAPRWPAGAVGDGQRPAAGRGAAAAAVASRSPRRCWRSERHGLGAAVLQPGVRRPPGARRRPRWRCARPDARADLVALAARCLRRRRAALAGALDRLAFEARERRSYRGGGLRRAAPRAALARGAPAPPRAVAACAASRPETVARRRGASARGPAEAAARRVAATTLRHRRLAITGDDLVAAGLSGPAVGRALDAATEAMLDGRGARPREAQLAAALAARPRRRIRPLVASAAVADPPLPRPSAGRAATSRAELPGARVLFSTRRGGRLAGAVRVAEPRPPDRRRRRERRREPRAAGRGRRRSRASGSSTAARSTARACAARTEPPGDDRPARGGGRPGDRAARRARRSSSSPTACPSRSPPTAPWRRSTAAGAAWRRASSARACAALREVGGERAGHRRARPGRRRLLLRGGGGGARRLRGLRRPPRRAQPRPGGGRARPARGGRRGGGPRRRPVHDVPDPGCSSPTARDGGVTGRQAGVVWRA